MRILTTSFGTLGDHLPVLALACALRDRGHAVSAAVGPEVLPLYRHEKVPATACGPGLPPPAMRAHPWLFDRRIAPPADREALSGNLEDMPRHYRELAQLARTGLPDLIIAGVGQRAARFVAEDLGLPWVSVCLRHGFYRGVPLQAEAGRHLPLLAVSPHFDDSPVDPRIVVTGFLPYSGAAQPGWTEPSPALRDFVAGTAGAGFLLLLPGSTPCGDGAACLRRHLEAARLLGRRLVVQRSAALGGADCAGAEAADVFCADHLPHDWLLARAAAVINPGRIGVVARALRAGCPVLAEPRTRDDHDHARRLLALGVGAALDPAALTATGIQRMLAERLLVPAVRRRTAALAARLASETGTAATVAAIEEWVARPPGRGAS